MTHIDPLDPWAISPESPLLALCPYGGNAYVVSSIWFLEILRRVEAGDWLSVMDENMQADLASIIGLYGDVLRVLIEADLARFKQEHDAWDPDGATGGGSGGAQPSAGD